MTSSLPHLRIPLLSAAVLTVLVSCAPTLTGPQLGRIVNSKTGQEGTVAFERGSLRPLIADPFAPNNAKITLGAEVYEGRTQVVGRSAAPLPAGWGLSVGFGGNTHAGEQGQFGWDTRLDSPKASEVSLTGNLIARTTGAKVRTLTCTLLVDAHEHGIGDCTGEDGIKYVLQF